jgi:hypothetical protein
MIHQLFADDVVECGFESVTFIDRSSCVALLNPDLELFSLRLLGVALRLVRSFLLLSRQPSKHHPCRMAVALFIVPASSPRR